MLLIDICAMSPRDAAFAAEMPVAIDAAMSASLRRARAADDATLLFMPLDATPSCYMLAFTLFCLRLRHIRAMSC